MILKLYKTHKETANNMFWRTVQVFGNKLFFTLITFLCMKLMSPRQFGVYKYDMGIVYLILMFSEAGIALASSKFIAQYNAINKDKVKAVFFNSGLILFVLSTFISITLLLFGQYFVNHKQYEYLIWIIPAFYLSPLTSLFDGMFRGLKRFRELSIINLSVSIVSLVIVYFLVEKYKVFGALMSLNLYNLLLLLVFLLRYKEIELKINFPVMKEIFVYSLLLGVNKVRSFLNRRVDVLMLGAFGFIKELAYYSVISGILNLFFITPFSIFSMVISPNVTSDFAEKRYDNLLSKFKKVITLSFFASVFIVTILFFFRQEFIDIFLYFFPQYLKKTVAFGDPTGMLLNILNLMLPIIFIQMIYIVIPNFMTATGHAKFQMIFFLVVGIINVLLELILLKMFGWIGVIYATIIIKYCSILTIIIIFYNKLVRLKNTITI